MAGGGPSGHFYQMKKNCFSAALAACLSLAGAANAQEALSPRQSQIALIAAYTANGDQKKLKTALAEGLGAGLTVNEEKEILTQLYAYTGFPRSLNAINTFMALMQEREAAGIKDNHGPEAKLMPADINKDECGKKVRNILFGREEEPPASGYQLFTPVIDTYLKEHLFCDIFYRDNLDYLSRELATISALAAMHGTQSQLASHLFAAKNMGLTAQQAQQWAQLIKKRVGRKEGKIAQKLTKEIFHQDKNAA